MDWEFVLGLSKQVKVTPDLRSKAALALSRPISWPIVPSSYPLQPISGTLRKAQSEESFSQSVPSQRAGGRRDFAVWKRALSYLANHRQPAAWFGMNRPSPSLILKLFKAWAAGQSRARLSMPSMLDKSHMSRYGTGLRKGQASKECGCQEGQDRTELACLSVTSSLHCSSGSSLWTRTRAL